MKWKKFHNLTNVGPFIRPQALEKSPKLIDIGRTYVYSGLWSISIKHWSRHSQEPQNIWNYVCTLKMFLI